MSALPEGLPALDACWNRIGVHGDASCGELAAQVHCRNCPVYSRGALALLDRARVHDLEETARLFAKDKQEQAGDRLHGNGFALGIDGMKRVKRAQSRLLGDYAPGSAVRS